jgi:hypothetical protein
MGYTHSWRRPQELPPALFADVREDLERLLLPLSDLGVHIADWDGRGVPYFDAEIIRFNGLRDCGHPKNEEIVFPFPAPEARGIGSSDTALPGDGSLGVFLKHRCCPGNCDYEPFRFLRVLNPCDDVTGDGLCWAFAKTGFRPYDLAVTSALLVAKRHIRERMIVETDGGELQWADAKELCQSVLGYGGSFGIVEERIREHRTDSKGTATQREVLLRTLVG